MELPSKEKETVSTDLDKQFQDHDKIYKWTHLTYNLQLVVKNYSHILLKLNDRFHFADKHCNSIILVPVPQPGEKPFCSQFRLISCFFLFYDQFTATVKLFCYHLKYVIQSISVKTCSDTFSNNFEKNTFCKINSDQTNNINIGTFIQTFRSDNILNILDSKTTSVKLLCHECNKLTQYNTKYPTTEFCWIFCREDENITLGSLAKIRLDYNLDLIFNSKTTSVKSLYHECNKLTQYNTKYPTTEFCWIFCREDENITLGSLAKIRLDYKLDLIFNSKTTSVKSLSHECNKLKPYNTKCPTTEFCWIFCREDENITLGSLAKIQLDYNFDLILNSKNTSVKLLCHECNKLTQYNTKYLTMELKVFWTKTENITIGCPAKIRLDDNLHILDSKTNSIKWLCSESKNTTKNNTTYPTTVYKIYWQEAENIDRKEIRHKYTCSELSFIKNLTNSPSLLKAFDKLKEKVPKQINTNVQYAFIGIYNHSNEKCKLVDFCNLKKAKLNNERNELKIHTEEYICKKADLFLKDHKVSADDMVVIFTKNSPCIVNKGKHSCMDFLHTYCKKWYDDYGIPSVIGFDQYYGFTGYNNYFSHLQNDEHLFHCLLSGTSKNCEHCKNNYSSKELQQAHDLLQNDNLILTTPDSSKFLKRMFKPLNERKKLVNDEKYITLPTIYETVENIKNKTEGLTNYKEYLNIENDIARTYPECMKTEFHKVWMLYIAHIIQVATVKHMDQKLKKNIFYAFLKHVEGEQYYTPFWCPLN